MDIQEKVSHAVAVTKWKVDNEMRQNDVRKKLNATKQTAYQKKNQLANLAYALYKQGEIENEKIKEKCAEIQELEALVNQHEKDIAEIKNESSPAPVIKANPFMLEGSTDTICPSCNAIVPARFCPNCGMDCG